MQVGGADGRMPQWFTPHTVNRVGTGPMVGIDNKYFNNINVNSGLNGVPMRQGYASDYNVFYGSGGQTTWGDAHSMVVASFNAAVMVTTLANGVTISYQTDAAPTTVSAPLITRSPYCSKDSLNAPKA